MVAPARQPGGMNEGRALLRLVEPWRPAPLLARARHRLSDTVHYAWLPLLCALLVAVLTRDPWAGAAILLGSVATVPLWRAVTGPRRRSLRGR